MFESRVMVYDWTLISSSVINRTNQAAILKYLETIAMRHSQWFSYPICDKWLKKKTTKRESTTHLSSCNKILPCHLKEAFLVKKSARTAVQSIAIHAIREKYHQGSLPQLVGGRCVYVHEQTSTKITNPSYHLIGSTKKNKSKQWVQAYHI